MPIVRPGVDDVRLFPRAADFRAWLADNHATLPFLWVGYYKKGVAKQAMTYVESVEEALCFGWIDGITYRIDDELTATRFTPRRRTSNWSASNLARVAKLSAAGRMAPAGVAAFDGRDRRKDASYSYERPAQQLPAEFLDHLRAEPVAWAFWERQAPSFRRQAAYWVASAKREETRQRRFDQLLESARAGRRPRPFTVGTDAGADAGPRRAASEPRGG